MKKNLSSQLRLRAILQEPVRTPDGLGGFSVIWEDIAEIWVALESGNNGGTFLAAQNESKMRVRVMLRERDDIAEGMRLQILGKHYLIKNIAIPLVAQGTVELQAEEIQ